MLSSPRAALHCFEMNSEQSGVASELGLVAQLSS